MARRNLKHKDDVVGGYKIILHDIGLEISMLVWHGATSADLHLLIWVAQWVSD